MNHGLFSERGAAVVQVDRLGPGGAARLEKAPFPGPKATLRRVNDRMTADGSRLSPQRVHCSVPVTRAHASITAKSSSSDQPSFPHGGGVAGC